jgi:hypothetical protein
LTTKALAELMLDELEGPDDRRFWRHPSGNLGISRVGLAVKSARRLPLAVT